MSLTAAPPARTTAPAPKNPVLRRYGDALGLQSYAPVLDNVVVGENRQCAAALKRETDSAKNTTMTIVTAPAKEETLAKDESTRLAPGEQSRSKRQPPYHVLLVDDDDHTYEYVIDMLRKLFGYTTEHAYILACDVDTRGRVILETTTKERAEFKRDQVLSFGRDWRITRCAGSMTSIIEPAE